mmetsp:Transcript_13877/g.38377  ORF Transcript_13877/g.38377 Transcript_13877/m.38377 type:complete len:140 (+) Transcript_13877:155-574(+)
MHGKAKTVAPIFGVEWRKVLTLKTSGWIHTAFTKQALAVIEKQGCFSWSKAMLIAKTETMKNTNDDEIGWTPTQYICKRKGCINILRTLSFRQVWDRDTRCLSRVKDEGLVRFGKDGNPVRRDGRRSEVSHSPCILSLV